MVSRSHSFGTFLIIGPTCFFLGILFAYFPYDYNVLWTTLADPAERQPYYDILETHLKFVYRSPPLISRILHIVMATGFLGFLFKLYKPSQANLLFDGASAVLYLTCVIIYITNIIKGLKGAHSGAYGAPIPAEEDMGQFVTETDVQFLSREDSLKVLAASNTILALVLIGVLVLQAGQWYAMRKEEAELEEMDRLRDEKREGKRKESSSAGTDTATSTGREGREGKGRHKKST